MGQDKDGPVHQLSLPGPLAGFGQSATTRFTQYARLGWLFFFLGGGRFLGLPLETSPYYVDNG